jgi:predicted signal transduction protein with EAL and GGDEF domain
MMVDADRAMYAAKAAGKGRFLFYAADMMAGAQNDGNGAAPERREATPARLELCA